MGSRSHTQTCAEIHCKDVPKDCHTNHMMVIDIVGCLDSNTSYCIPMIYIHIHIYICISYKFHIYKEWRSLSTNHNLIQVLVMFPLEMVKCWRLDVVSQEGHMQLSFYPNGSRTLASSNTEASILRDMDDRNHDQFWGIFIGFML